LVTGWFDDPFHLSGLDNDSRIGRRLGKRFLTTGGEEIEEVRYRRPKSRVAVKTPFDRGPERVIDFSKIGLKVRDPEHDRIGSTLSIGVPARGCVGENQTQVKDVALLGDNASKDLLR
tara:strand:+ start:238 stop:591 length:354 start_codon:yes stop_codon:yes gene_type:complete